MRNLLSPQEEESIDIALACYFIHTQILSSPVHTRAHVASTLLVWTFRGCLKDLFLLKDPNEGKEILEHIQETIPLIDMHNDAPLEDSAVTNRGISSAKGKIVSIMIIITSHIMVRK